MLLNKACARSDVRAGSLHFLCGGDFSASHSRFLGLSSQGVWSLWKHTGPPFPCGWLQSEWDRERAAGQGPADDWVLRLVAVNRGRKQDEVFIWASGNAIEIPSSGNLHCGYNSSVIAHSKHVSILPKGASWQNAPHWRYLYICHMFVSA